MQAVRLWYAGTLSWSAANLSAPYCASTRALSSRDPSYSRLMRALAVAMLAFAGVGWSYDRRRVTHAGDKRDVAVSETTPAVIP